MESWTLEKLLMLGLASDSEGVINVDVTAGWFTLLNFSVLLRCCFNLHDFLLFILENFRWFLIY